jgi:DeoR/GlpR family transcriptional regulator of sugar metabolism
MNRRQEKIIEFAKKNNAFKNKDLVIFFDNKYSRETITRDLSFLCEQKFLNKTGAGAFVAYSLSENYKILEKIDVEKYFETPILKEK